MLATATIIALVLALIVQSYGLRRALYESNARAAHRDQISAELEATRADYRTVCDLLDPQASSSGGVHKRIEEIREIKEAIDLNHPEMFQKVPGLVHWISASDQFLCRLRDVVMTNGKRHE